MSCPGIVLALVISLSASSLSQAQSTEQSSINEFFDPFESLAYSGIEVGFGLTNIYQQNVHGGLSTHRKAGRYSGSYDIEVLADLEKLLGFERGLLFMHLEGGWPDTEGIDAGSIGSVFGVNADAIGNRAMDVKQLFYEGILFSDNLTFMAGKIDFTGVFDTSAYADDECSQFLNPAFVDNPTIPFPDYSLGAVLTYNPTKSWYLMCGIADAQADSRETGFRTAFHNEDYFLYMCEVGFASELASANGAMPGTYRAGLWNDPQPKANSDSAKSYRDDVGFYLSFDQMLEKENDDPQDTQGLGAFLRYGSANSRKNDIAGFWSFGFQYQGLIEGRDNDVLGAGFAQGIFSNSASAANTQDYESVIELYYSARITPCFSLSPNIQYIANPSSPDNPATADDAVVLGMRLQMNF